MNITSQSVVEEIEEWIGSKEFETIIKTEDYKIFELRFKYFKLREKIALQENILNGMSSVSMSPFVTNKIKRK